MNRSIRRRRVFTGESYQQAFVAIALLEAGQRLIVDATDGDQQRIEAVLLHRMLHGWARRPSATTPMTVFGVRTVQPSPTGLKLLIPAGAEPTFANSLTTGQGVPAARQAVDAIAFQRRSGCHVSISAYGIAAEVSLTCSWSDLQDALRPGSVQDKASVITLDATAGAVPAAAYRSTLSALLRRLVLFTREDHFHWLLTWYARLLQGRSAPSILLPADLAAFLADPHFGVSEPVLDMLQLTSPTCRRQSVVDAGVAGAVTTTWSTRSHNLADDMPIGRRIAYWRGRRRMSQQVFADRMGRSKSWVDKSGAGSPSPRQVLRGLRDRRRPRRRR